MNNNYKVVYDGSLKEGTQPEQFIQGFMKIFKASETQARQLVSVGRMVTLKNNLDQAAAERICQAMDKLGMRVRVEALAVDVPPIQKAAPTVIPVTPPPQEITDNGLRCPKCGSNRVRDDDCLACGIIISRYIDRQARLASETMQMDNPYAAPQSDVTPVSGDDPSVMDGPHSVPAGNGWKWITGGWSHFSKSPFAWIGAIVVWAILIVVMSLIPLLGSLLTYLLGPVFAAGFMLGADEQRKGGNFELGHLFAGFSNNTGALVVVGLLNLLGMVAIVLITVGIFGGSLLAAKGSLQSGSNALASLATFGLPIVVMLVLMMLLMMAYFFAPALVALEGVTPLNAMKMSFSACLKNVMPFLVYGLLTLLLLIVAVIPIGLGLLVLAPMLTAAIYVSYRDIFYPSQQDQ